MKFRSCDAKRKRERLLPNTKHLAEGSERTLSSARNELDSSGIVIGCNK